MDVSERYDRGGFHLPRSIRGRSRLAPIHCKETNLLLRISLEGFAENSSAIRGPSISGSSVILDSDLAKIYGVTTRRLNEQIKRNIERVPADFMIRLSAREFDRLMSQNATSSFRHGGRCKLPFSFTEHGAIMADSDCIRSSLNARTLARPP